MPPSKVISIYIMHAPQYMESIALVMCWFPTSLPSGAQIKRRAMDKVPSPVSGIGSLFPTL